MVIRHLAIVLIALVPVLAACNTMKSLLGSESRGEPTALKSAESRWLLIKNPRFGDVPSEPEYVWVEEDKVPTTLTTLIRGKGAIIATPEVVAKYGAPPRGPQRGGGDSRPGGGGGWSGRRRPPPGGRGGAGGRRPARPWRAARRRPWRRRRRRSRSVATSCTSIRPVSCSTSRPSTAYGRERSSACAATRFRSCTR